MKKVYNNPITEIIGLEADTYLCQAVSERPSLSIGQGDSSEPAF